jgi:protein SCO1
MWMCGLAFLALLSGGAPKTEPASRLAVIQTPPDFVLTDQDGKEVRWRDLRGHVALVSFVFTTCNGTCPATTHRMCQVQQELKKRGLLDGGRVHLVSISLDPARDTPRVLKDYAALYDADLATWSFLTGPPADVERTIASWGMWVKPAANGQLNHPSRIFLVDRHGRVREIYNLGFLKADNVAEDVALLLDEDK